VFRLPACARSPGQLQAGIMEALRRLSLISKVTIEIQNHWGIEDKTLAEFVIEIGETVASVSDFEAKLEENGAAATGAFSERLFELIQKMGGPKKGAEPEKKGSRPLGDKDLKFPGLAMPDNKSRNELKLDAQSNDLSSAARKLLNMEKGEEEMEAERKAGAKELRERSRSRGKKEKKNDRGKVVNGPAELYGIYKGQVSRIMEYGCFINFETSEGRKEGLAHLSEVTKETRNVSRAGEYALPQCCDRSFVFQAEPSTSTTTTTTILPEPKPFEPANSSLPGIAPLLVHLGLGGLQVGLGACSRRRGRVVQAIAVEVVEPAADPPVPSKDWASLLSQAEFVASASFPPEVPPKPSAPVPVAKATLGESGPKRPSDLLRNRRTEELKARAEAYYSQPGTGATTSAEGEALAPKFGEWITERMKSGATNWESQRQYNEERRGSVEVMGDGKGSKGAQTAADKSARNHGGNWQAHKFSSPAFGVRARDRRHGDPFPLPVPSSHSALFRAANTGQRQVFEAFHSLNALAGPTLKSASAQQHSLPPSADLKPTSVQQWMMDDVVERISRHGSQPADLSEESSLGELLASSGPYSGDVGHLASFDISKIKVLSRPLRPQEAASLCPPRTAGYYKHFRHVIERDERELEVLRESNYDGLTPYWDPKLKRSRGARIGLYQALHRVGLLTFRRRAKAKVGFFVVAKKDGMQRLIVDARVPNMCHRRPPSTRLGTSGAYLNLDLGDHAASGFGPVYEPSGNEGDVGDCFYNFLQEDLASWFCADDWMTSEEWMSLGINVGEVFDDELRCKLYPSREERLCPGVCMGWSWALHMAQEIVSHQVSQTENFDKSDQIRDKQVAPLLQPGRPVLGIYVDNVAIIGGVPEDADRRMRAVCERFGQLGIPFVVTHKSSQSYLDTIGLRFDFARGALMHKSRRCWRLRLATLALLRRRKVRGSVLQVWGGHVIHHFSLLRPGMSCLHSFYRFIEFAGNEQKVLWPSVRQEMRLVIGLVFLGEAHLGAPIHENVYLGDSSTYGFSLMVTKSSQLEVRQATLHRERWRFIAPDVELGAPLVSPLDFSSLGGLSPLGGDVVPPPGLWPPGAHEISSGWSRGSCPGAGFGTSTQYGRQLLQQAELRRKPVQSWRPSRPPRPLVEVPDSIPVIGPEWDKQDRYTLLVAAPRHHTAEHINIKEMRVLLMGVRRCCRDRSALGHRVLLLSDNLVSVLALEKGRSSSYSLNLLCRRAAAYSIGGRISFRFRHIGTDRNVADAPSRWFDPPGSKHSRQCSNSPRTAGTPPPGPRRRFGGRDPKAAPEGKSPRSTTRGTASCKPAESAADGPHDVSPVPDLAFPVLPVASKVLTSRPQQPKYFLELFSGSGVLTTAFKQAGCNVLPACEILNGVQFDLTRHSTQEAMLRLLRTGRVWYVHMGTPCTVWSRARHGLTNMARARAKETVGVELALFSVAVARLASSLNIWWSIENPRSSRLWNFHPVSELLQLPHTHWFHWDMCMYDSPNKKPTATMTNCPSLAGLARACQGGHKHVVLRGTERVRLPDGLTVTRNKTAGAGVYPANRSRLSAMPLELRAPLSMALLCNMSKRRNELTTTSLGTPATGRSATMSPSSSASIPMPKRRSYGSSGQSGLASSSKRGRVLCAKTGAGVLLQKSKQLKCRKVTSNTLARYSSALEEFDTWAKKNKRGVGPLKLDASMVEFMRQQYEAGCQSWEGSYLVYGHQLLRHTGLDSSCLPESKKALKGWKTGAPGRMRLPYPEEVILDVADFALGAGNGEAAFAIALQLDGYFRPSEVLNLTVKQVMPPARKAGRAYAKAWGIVLAPAEDQKPTKTGQFDDSVLIGDIQHEWLGPLLELLTKNKAPEEKLFPSLSLASYERLFRDAMQKRYNKFIHVTPHSVRHSGPSNDKFHKRRSLLQIQKRGRWASPKSVTRYEKEALLLGIWRAIPENQHSDISARSREFPSKLFQFFNATPQ
ncbi:unnamed protein product, partial [Polarella glacialis]